MNIEITPNDIEPTQNTGTDGIQETPETPTVRDESNTNVFETDNVSPVSEGGTDYGIVDIDILKEADAKDVEDDMSDAHDIEPVQPKTFRKKPVEIEAMLWTGGAENATPIIDWIISSGPIEGFDGDNTATYFDKDEVDGEAIMIYTLEGDMMASPGDWIIRGLKGEFYPCKPGIFDESYESGELSVAVEQIKEIEQDEDVNRRVFELCKELSYIGAREIMEKMDKHGFTFTKKS